MGGQRGRPKEGPKGRSKGEPKMGGQNGRSKEEPKEETDLVTRSLPSHHVVVQQFTYKTNKKAKRGHGPSLKYTTGSHSKNYNKYCTCSVTKQVATVS